jgi:hypothetical protein
LIYNPLQHRFGFLFATVTLCALSFQIVSSNGAQVLREIVFGRYNLLATKGIKKKLIVCMILELASL